MMMRGRRRKYPCFGSFLVRYVRPHCQDVDGMCVYREVWRASSNV